MSKDVILQKGDRIQFLSKYGHNNFETVLSGWSGKSIKEFENDEMAKVIKVERPQTIYEFKEVLDAKEKEYLSNLIEPFKKRVIHIEKIKKLYGNSEFVNIVLYNSISYNKEESIQLPYFKKGTMYKGMELGKKYTLKELGLD